MHHTVAQQDESASSGGWCATQVHQIPKGMFIRKCDELSRVVEFDQCIPSRCSSGSFMVLCGVDPTDPNVRLRVEPDDTALIANVQDVLDYGKMLVGGMCMSCSMFATTRCTAPGEVLIDCGASFSVQLVDPYTWIGDMSGRCETCAALGIEYCDKNFKKEYGTALTPDQFYISDCSRRQNTYVDTLQNSLTCKRCDPTRCHNNQQLQYCGGDFPGFCVECTTSAYLQRAGVLTSTDSALGAPFICVPYCAGGYTGDNCAKTCGKVSTLTRMFANHACVGDVRLFAVKCEPPLEAGCRRCLNTPAVDAMHQAVSSTVFNLFQFGSFDNALYIDENDDYGTATGSRRIVHSATDTHPYFQHLYVWPVQDRPASNADASLYTCVSQRRAVVEDHVLHAHTCSSAVQDVDMYAKLRPESFLVIDNAYTATPEHQLWVRTPLLNGNRPDSNWRVVSFWVSLRHMQQQQSSIIVLANATFSVHMPVTTQILGMTFSNVFRSANIMQLPLSSDKWTYVRATLKVMTADGVLYYTGRGRSISWYHSFDLSINVSALSVQDNLVAGLAIDDVMVYDALFISDFEGMDEGKYNPPHALTVAPDWIAENGISRVYSTAGYPSIDQYGMDVSHMLGSRFIFTDVQWKIFKFANPSKFDIRGKWLTVEFLGITLSKSEPRCQVQIGARYPLQRVRLHHTHWTHISVSFEANLLTDGTPITITSTDQFADCRTVGFDNFIIWEKPNSCPWNCGPYATRTIDPVTGGPACTPCQVEPRMCVNNTGFYVAGCTVDGFRAETLCIPCSNAPLAHAHYVTRDEAVPCEWVCDDNFFPQQNNVTLAVACVPCTTDPATCEVGFYLSQCKSTNPATGVTLPVNEARDSECVPCQKIQLLEDPRAVELAFYTTHGLVYGQDSCSIECGSGLWKNSETSQCYPCSNLNCAAIPGAWKSKPCSYIADDVCVPCPELPPNTYRKPQGVCAIECVAKTIPCAPCQELCGANSTCWKEKHVNLLQQMPAVIEARMTTPPPSPGDGDTVAVAGSEEIPAAWDGSLQLLPQVSRTQEQTLYWLNEVTDTRMFWHDISLIQLDEHSDSSSTTSFACRTLRSCRVMYMIETVGWVDVSFVTWLSVVNGRQKSALFVVWMQPQIGEPQVVHRQLVDINAEQSRMVQWLKLMARPGTYYVCIWFASTSWSLMGTKYSKELLQEYDVNDNALVVQTQQTFFTAIPRGIESTNLYDAPTPSFGLSWTFANTDPLKTRKVNSDARFNSTDILIDTKITRLQAHVIDVAALAAVVVFRSNTDLPFSHPTQVLISYISAGAFLNGLMWRPSGWYDTDTGSIVPTESSLQIRFNSQSAFSLECSVGYLAMKSYYEDTFSYWHARIVDANRRDVLPGVELLVEDHDMTLFPATVAALEADLPVPNTHQLYITASDVGTLPAGEYTLILAFQHVSFASRMPDKYWPFVLVTHVNLTLINLNDNIACAQCNFYDGQACQSCDATHFPPNSTAYTAWSNGKQTCKWRCDGDFALAPTKDRCIFCPVKTCAIGEYMAECVSTAVANNVTECAPCSHREHAALQGEVVFTSPGSARFTDDCAYECRSGTFKVMYNARNPRFIAWWQDPPAYLCVPCSQPECVAGQTYLKPCTVLLGDARCVPCTAVCAADTFRTSNCTVTDNTVCTPCSNSSSLLPQSKPATLEKPGARAVYVRRTADDTRCEWECTYQPPLDMYFAVIDAFAVPASITRAYLSGNSFSCEVCSPRCDIGFYATQCAEANSFTGCSQCIIPVNAIATSSGQITENSCRWLCRPGLKWDRATRKCVVITDVSLGRGVSAPLPSTALPCSNVCAANEFQFAPPDCACVPCESVGMKKPNGTMSRWVTAAEYTLSTQQCQWDCTMPYVRHPEYAYCVQSSLTDADRVLGLSSTKGSSKSKDVNLYQYIWGAELRRSSTGNSTAIFDNDREVVASVTVPVILIFMSFLFLMFSLAHRRKRRPRAAASAAALGH